VDASCDAIKNAHVPTLNVGGTVPFHVVLQATRVSPEIQFLVGGPGHVVAVANVKRAVVDVDGKRISG